MIRNLIQPISLSAQYCCRQSPLVERTFFRLGQSYIHSYRFLYRQLKITPKWYQSSVSRADTVAIGTQMLGEGTLAGGGAYWYKRRMSSRPKRWGWWGI